MKKPNKNLVIILLLVLLAALLYGLQLLIFHDQKDTAFYLLQDLAFLSLQVAIVTVALGWLLRAQEKKDRLKKANMQISAFFSEAGTDMIRSMLSFAVLPEGGWGLEVTAKWAAADFQKAAARVRGLPFTTEAARSDLAALKRLLLEKRSFLLSMLASPNLLEHDTFTDMLWAVNHLADELKLRDSLDDLPAADMNHLALDINRALRAVLVQWVYYMEHLKTDYLYLFSLEVRNSPFSMGASVVITE